MDECPKTPYTKREAQTVRNLRLKGRHGRPEMLRLYECKQCGAWHLTSKESYSEVVEDE